MNKLDKNPSYFGLLRRPKEKRKAKTRVHFSIFDCYYTYFFLGCLNSPIRHPFTEFTLRQGNAHRFSYKHTVNHRNFLDAERHNMVPSWYHVRHYAASVNFMYMMTSSNGNISALLAIYAGNSPVTGEFHSQGPVTRSFDDFFDLGLNKRLSKQSWGWWCEMALRSLWRHRNENNQHVQHTPDLDMFSDDLPGSSYNEFWKYSGYMCTHVLQSCFHETGEIIHMIAQTWNTSDRYKTTRKHNKARNLCIILRLHCDGWCDPIVKNQRPSSFYFIFIPVKATTLDTSNGESRQRGQPCSHKVDVK